MRATLKLLMKQSEELWIRVVKLLAQATTAPNAPVSLQQVQNPPSVKPAVNTSTKPAVSPRTLPSAKPKATK